MDVESDKEALRALAREHASPSKMAKLRAILDEIEATQDAGVSNAKIVETLNARGYDLTLKTFNMLLYRLRKEREPAKQESQQTAATPKQQAPSKPESTSIGGPSSTGKGGDTPQPSRRITNPADLKRSRERDLDLDDYTDPNPK